MHRWAHVLIIQVYSSCTFCTFHRCLPQRTTAFGAAKTRLTLFAASRWYAAAPDPLDVNGSGDSEEEQERVIDNPRVHKLVDQICEMNILEIADLTELLRKRLGITAPPPGMYAMGGFPFWTPSAILLQHCFQCFRNACLCYVHDPIGFLSLIMQW